ncbi:MAG: hypothetical protein JWO65_708 [Sphingomonas bacterium]|jgi:hypothetical protein|nr:hypothetical protein [Sphingomonas bacterium]
MNVVTAARSLFVACAGFLVGLLLAALAVPVAARAETPPPAPAQTAANVPTNESKTISIVVYGSDPCPPSTNGDIVVCARQPESERYRIPKRFRGKKQEPAANNAWGNKVRADEDASRTAAGLPDTCSAVGSGGQSGCFAHFQSQMATQRRQQKQDNADVDGQGFIPPQ